MNYPKMLSVVALAVGGWITSNGQVVDAEVPGDHFSLEGALELFKKSESPEAFEKLLNSPDSKVNNLDLNEDGYIDYVRVFDRQEGNVHVFILQAVVSESESQDIAVIELEKLANGKAVLQIIGDEDIYGVETIIEPTREVRTYAGTTSSRTVVNVWSWPIVYHVYSPYYTAWHSPWGWHYRPVWYSTWRPVVYVHYHDYWRPYRRYYSPCHTRRVVYAYNVYHPYRTTSVIVRDRHHHKVKRYREEYAKGNSRNDNYGKRTSRGSARYSDSGNSRSRQPSTSSRSLSAERQSEIRTSTKASRENTGKVMRAESARPSREAVSEKVRETRTQTRSRSKVTTSTPEIRTTPEIKRNATPEIERSAKRSTPETRVEKVNRQRSESGSMQSIRKAPAVERSTPQRSVSVEKKAPVKSESMRRSSGQSSGSQGGKKVTRGRSQ